MGPKPACARWHLKGKEQNKTGYNTQPRVLTADITSERLSRNRAAEQQHKTESRECQERLMVQICHWNTWACQNVDRWNFQKVTGEEGGRRLVSAVCPFPSRNTCWRAAFREQRSRPDPVIYSWMNLCLLTDRSWSLINLILSKPTLPAGVRSPLSAAFSSL